MPQDTNEALFEYLLRLGDDRLVLGHRLSEWCGHGPILEEDIALANIGLDCLGHATNLLHLAGEIEGKGRSEDDLAYFREATEFRNLMLVEQPKGDFAFTMVRQFLFDAYSYLLYEELQKSKHQELAGIAAKAFKEICYHLRHSRQWMLRLGDGTEESHKRAEIALEDIWIYTGELFTMDEIDHALVKEGISPHLESLKPKWQKQVQEVLSEATLKIPSDQDYMATGSRKGKHTEYLGHMLAEMQILARSFSGSGAKW